MGGEAGVEALALPSRDTFFLALVGQLDAGFRRPLFRAIRRSLDSPDRRKAYKRNRGGYDMPSHWRCSPGLLQSRSYTGKGDVAKAASTVSPRVGLNHRGTFSVIKR